MVVFQELQGITSFPSFFTDLGVCFSYSFSSVHQAAFCFLFNTFPQRCQHPDCGAQPCPTVDLLELLEQAEPSTGHTWPFLTDVVLADPPPPQHHLTLDKYRQYNVMGTFLNSCIFSYYTASTFLIYLVITNAIFNFADFNLLPFNFLVVEYFD